MKVYVDCPSNMSQAMFRVARALKEYAPDTIEVVADPSLADLQVLHVIGFDALSYVTYAPEIAVIQYCGCAAHENGINVLHEDIKRWHPLWNRAAVVWSYYDLADAMPSGAEFYHAPLGIDRDFIVPDVHTVRTVGVVTSGYVSGPGAEPIWEMAIAAEAMGLQVVHIGPNQIQGAPHGFPRSWRNIQGAPDAALADIYSHAQYVSGMRYLEGFEMPVIEGLSCGAQPIVFDRPDMRYWYRAHARFVKECSGRELIDELVKVLSSPQPFVKFEERHQVRSLFSWERVIPRFWNKVLERTRVAA